MSNINNQLEVSELDFQNIKDSLKNYLKNQSQFADFDFEGSNLNILLDILAYNTHYQTYYLNMIANEMFLDSAQLRSSVVSRAKELGYLPHSARGASSYLNINITPDTNDVERVTIPKNLEFTTEVDDDTLTFVTPESTILSQKDNGTFSANVEIVEGVPLSHRFTFSTNTSFTIPNLDVDTRSIQVKIYESNDDTNPEKYNIADNITSVQANTKSFFLDGEGDGYYKVYFGDNVIGETPKSGSIVQVEYRVCNGTQGNGADNFDLVNDNINGYSNVVFSVLSSATGGVYQEDIDSIKFNAPKEYGTQNRAVTEEDYRNIILRENPDLQTIKVWGGEENDPPKFGRVMISTKPKNKTTISEERKRNIINNLEKYNVVSIKPEIIDPTFLYVVPEINAFFDNNSTDKDVGTIVRMIADTVVRYETKKLGNFGDKFRYSRFISEIDNTEDSITNNITDIRMQKRFVPLTEQTITYEIRFGNEISRPKSSNHPVHEGSHEITSSNFTFNNESGCKFDDDGEGTLRIYRINNKNKKIYLSRNIGTINYLTGTIFINAINIQSFEGADLKIYAKPSTNNIKSNKNQILLIDETIIRLTDENNKRIQSITKDVKTAGSTTATNENAIPTVRF